MRVIAFRVAMLATLVTAAGLMAKSAPLMWTALALCAVGLFAFLVALFQDGGA